MKSYFFLHYKRVNRMFVKLGVPIILGYILFASGFVFGSEYLFSKMDDAVYCYVIIGLLVVSKLSEVNRNDFLKTHFINYRNLRLVENTLIMLPFVSFLLYKGYFIIIPPFIFLTLLLSFVHFKNNFSYVVPTPFSKKPFEFSIGFRKTFIVYPILYFLAYKAVSVNNFNLGIFSIIATFCTIMYYYSVPEKEYYAWVYNLSPNEFLKEKIKAGLINSSLLVSPIAIYLSISFFSSLIYLLVFLLLCYLYIVLIVLIKYSVFPKNMEIPEGVLLALSISFPPMLIVVIPYVYKKSIKRLTPVLNDQSRKVI